jgi:hypothetical protein
LKAFSVEVAPSRDLTAVEIELSVPADAGLPAVLAVPPLVPLPERAAALLAAPPDAEPAEPLPEAELPPPVPDRAAPPSMATAQPESTAVAIIPMIAATAQALAPTLASTFTGTPVWWRHRRREACPALVQRIDELPLLERTQVAPPRDLVARAQATDAVARRAENADIDAR